MRMRNLSRYCIQTFASQSVICYALMTGWMTRTLWIFMTTHLSLMTWWDNMQHLRCDTYITGLFTSQKTRTLIYWCQVSLKRLQFISRCFLQITGSIILCTHSVHLHKSFKGFNWILKYSHKSHVAVQIIVVLFAQILRCQSKNVAVTQYNVGVSFWRIHRTNCS